MRFMGSGRESVKGTLVTITCVVSYSHYELLGLPTSPSSAKIRQIWVLLPGARIGRSGSRESYVVYVLSVY